MRSPDLGMVVALCLTFAALTAAKGAVASEADGHPPAKAAAKDVPEIPDTAPVPAVPLEVGQIDLVNRLRALRLMQDRVAQGNATALQAQRALLAKLEDIFIAEAARLRHPRMRIALGSFLLNGGNPARLRQLVAEDPDSPGDDFLMGALAWAEGRQALAMSRLAAVDAALLPLAEQAHLALVVGSLVMASDPERARNLFQTARLIAPGTLIEEAALRREAELSGDDPGRLLGVVQAYLSRFGQSPFAGAFIVRFAQLVAGLPKDKQAEIRDRLDPLLAMVRGPGKAEFYAVVARASLVNGDRDLARHAAARAVEHSSEATNADRLRASATLYEASAAIAGDEFRPAVAALRSLDRSLLSEQDRTLLDAAVSVARELRRWPEAERIEAADRIAASLPDSGEAPAPSPVMAEAELLLKATDALLAGD